MTEAAEKQMKKLWHTTNIYMQPAIHEYARKLAQKLPEHLKVDNDVDILLLSKYLIAIQILCQGKVTIMYTIPILGVNINTFNSIVCQN